VQKWLVGGNPLYLKFWIKVTALERNRRFYRAACRRGLAMRILSVRLSVCPSVTRVNCDKTVGRSVQIYIPYERTFSLVFWEEEWLRITTSIISEDMMMMMIIACGVISYPRLNPVFLHGSQAYPRHQIVMFPSKCISPIRSLNFNCSFLLSLCDVMGIHRLFRAQRWHVQFS